MKTRSILGGILLLAVSLCYGALFCTGWISWPDAALAQLVQTVPVALALWLLGNVSDEREPLSCLPALVLGVILALFGREWRGGLPTSRMYPALSETYVLLDLESPFWLALCLLLIRCIEGFVRHGLGRFTLRTSLIWITLVLLLASAGAMRTQITHSVIGSHHTYPVVPVRLMSVLYCIFTALPLLLLLRPERRAGVWLTAVCGTFFVLGLLFTDVCYWKNPLGEAVHALMDRLPNAFVRLFCTRPVDALYLLLPLTVLGVRSLWEGRRAA